MKSLAAVVVAAWLGVMGGFSFLAAPAAFGTLEREAAGRFVAAVFPRYYLVGVVLGLVALGGLVGHWLSAGARSGDWLPAALVLSMLALSLYAWLAVLPAAHAAREAMRRAPADPASADARSFARLHRLSAILNGLAMLAGVAVVALHVGRRP
jgi:hypothetical protein